MFIGTFLSFLLRKLYVDIILFFRSISTHTNARVRTNMIGFKALCIQHVNSRLPLNV